MLVVLMGGVPSTSPVSYPRQHSRAVVWWFPSFLLMKKKAEQGVPPFGPTRLVPRAGAGYLKRDPKPSRRVP